MRTPAVALVLAALLVSETFAGHGAPSIEPSFTPLPTVRPSVRPVDPGADRVIVDVGIGVRPMPSRPVVSVPSPRLWDVPVVHGPAVPASGGDVPDRGRVDRGVASWYDDGPGLYAAVNSYRWGDPRYTVRVCVGSRCVTAMVRDFCQCHVGTSRERVIDLSPDAFRRLAPLSQGLVKVTVTW